MEKSVIEGEGEFAVGFASMVYDVGPLVVCLKKVLQTADLHPDEDFLFVVSHLSFLFFQRSQAICRVRPMRQ